MRRAGTDVRGAPLRLCLVLTARPEFQPPWTMVGHLTTLMLRRLTLAQIAPLATHVAGHKALPAAVHDALMARLDRLALAIAVEMYRAEWTTTGMEVSKSCRVCTQESTSPAPHSAHSALA